MRTTTPFSHSHIIDKLAIINGIISGVALYPQIYTVLIEHVPNTLSPISLSLLLLNSVLWLIYAVHRSLISLFISSILNTIAVTILFLI